MLLSEFDYELPEELIAHHPAADRTGSRLLCLDVASGAMEDRRFAGLTGCLRPGDLMVFNDTRVIPARLFGVKDSGGRVEMLIERVLTDNRVMAQLRASKSPKPGTILNFESRAGAAAAPGASAEVMGRDGEFFLVQFGPQQDLGELLRDCGHMPLPPYIKREDVAADRERYQTVYAARDGAVAAPTAGLHFDRALLDELDRMGVDRAFLTLHVGAGTFQPVRSQTVEDHRMHRERVELTRQVCERVAACKARGGRVIAVGTTAVRSLEAAACGGRLQPFTGETDIFIYPGFEFRVVDAMITNFHLPQSTLLMLVSAFAGKKMLLDAYRHAIAQKYRFFSYGDAMFLFNGPAILAD